MNTLVSAILFLTLLVPLVCTASDGDIFTNETVGFEITKPKAWVFMTAKQNFDNLKAVKLTDKEFHEQMLKYATVPLVVMTKYPEPYEDVNPSIKINVKPYGPLQGKTPIELIHLILPQLKGVFKDFNLEKGPISVKVAGIPSGYARVSYTLVVQSGRTFPITSELWIVPRGDYFFMIGAGTRQDETTGTRAEIANIIETMKFEP